MGTWLHKTQRLVSSFIAAMLVLPHVACAQDTSSSTQTARVLVKVADVALPGSPVRFDYQSLDTVSGRLYISHMNADQLVVFDTASRKVVANLNGFKRVHGVIAVPELGRVFASTTGEHTVTVVDSASLATIARPGPISYPDGLAYAPGVHRVFVSDEHGGADAVIDATSNALVKSIPLGGGAGNTVYDPVSGHILVAVHDVNQLVSIDPGTATIVGRLPLTGIANPHGIALDVAGRLAFVAGEQNHSVAVVDLAAMKMVSVYETGDDPDVLAYDSGLKRLYVSSESGTVTLFQQKGRALSVLSEFHMPHAHTVCVDPKSHLVYFPLENIDGHPLLRIMKPADLP